MNKILFFAHDPGGANAVAPLIPKLADNLLCVYGQGPAAKIFNVPEYCGTAEQLFSSVRPDLLITGTSAANKLEKELRLISKKNAVPCLAVLDFWSNYGIRFSPYSTAEKNLYEQDKIFPFLPDYLIVMDEYAKQQCILEGIPESVIYPFGNPHFDTIRSQRHSDTAQIRAALLKNKKKLIVFASECTTEDYGNGTELETVQDILSIMPDTYQLAIKKHPRDSKNKYSRYSEFVINEEYSSVQVISASDIVISKSSMMLIEAALLGKPIISYQKHAQTDSFILSKMGAIHPARTKEELSEQIRHTDMYNQKFFFKQNITIQLIRFIKELLCQN